jgi:hypothetical protein
MKVDSSASYFLRQLTASVLAAVALAGCSAEGTSTADVTFSDPGVPFSFRLPPAFTDEKVDAINSRGDVVAVRALDKVNVIAVRRVGGRLTAPRETRLRILGKDVTSRVEPVGRGWALECQWTGERRAKVLEACREARRTVRFTRPG